MAAKAGLLALLALLLTAPAAGAQMPGGAPQAPPGALHRYYSGSIGTHWVTTKPVGGDYAYEFSLGFLLTTPGPGRTAIYGCRAGAADQFLSKDPNCEGQQRLGVQGWIEEARPSDAPSAGLYRCLRPGIAHFASNDAACEGFPSEGRLGYIRLRQNALSRYWNNGHWVTSGNVGAGWGLESTLGFLLPTGGDGKRALYECANGGDRFLSLDPGCEGRTELGLSGYLYSYAVPGEDLVPIYRCRIGGDHFASQAANCEGQVSEGLLGYAQRRQDVINRAYNPATGTHQVTTGPIAAGYFHELTLGYALDRDGGDRQAVFGCLHGASDHFLSLDAGCEGQRAMGGEGRLYTSQPAGVDTVPVFRCVTAVDHFASNDGRCEGQRTEALLGYARAEGPEPPPPPPLALRNTCAPSGVRLSASLRGKRVRRIHYGRSGRISGRLRNPDGSPIGGATVSILIGTRRPLVLGEVVTAANGYYSFRVRPGKNRIIHAGYRTAPDALDLACSRNVRLNVRAGITLRASRSVPRGGRARFRGRLLGKPIPRVGKLVDLQAFDGGRWRTFATTRTNRKGRYRASYRFIRTSSPRTFRFRARARKEARYPYALGTSKVVRVRVR
ncbi:MAG TPA: carboxypeptidase-like regulatory domain-containing protein [Solirubrobacteraceae bacterium]|nr:carboxypeptidase-like regulatory domain-containing protein [Solirubrobacteraceae bacterium]